MMDSVKVPFYLLGFLLRFGPQHGYELKLRLRDQASDFARIKAPNLYYHLGAMKRKGWVRSETRKRGKRPAAEVFTVTASGRAQFRRLLARCLTLSAEWEFPVDGAIYFGAFLDPGEAAAALRSEIKRLTARLATLVRHEAEALPAVAEGHRTAARALFRHHAEHLRAEIRWATSVVSRDGVGKKMKGADGRSESRGEA